jgi:hypothetical protein
VSFNLTLLGFINNECRVDRFVVMGEDEKEEVAENSGVD